MTLYILSVENKNSEDSKLKWNERTCQEKQKQKRVRSPDSNQEYPYKIERNMLKM